jgi:hypothetical protein
MLIASISCESQCCWQCDQPELLAMQQQLCMCLLEIVRLLCLDGVPDTYED